MTDVPDPRWELLPHDPESFFELPHGYDLRELRRRYNRFIRRFKPEKFPEQFQRIRSAFESLNDALRYNLSTGPVEQADWETELAKPLELAPTQKSSDPSKTSESSPIEKSLEQRQSRTSPVPPLNQRVATTSAGDLYTELKSQLEIENTPHRYYHLAVLSDVVSCDHLIDKNEETFVGWILKGLQSYPDNRGLICLLREYLTQIRDVTDLVDLLPRIVRITRCDQFGYATERAWDFLIRNASFEVFRDCFETCSTRLGASIDDSVLTFYLHVLRPAMWNADDDWIDSIVATLDDHYFQLGRWAQEEYELTSELLNYRQHRKTFIAFGACCERVDRAIQDWCLLPETEGDLSILDCQYFLSAHGQQLLEELHEPDMTLIGRLDPWAKIVDDVLDRMDEPELVSKTVLVNNTLSLMIRVSRRNQRTRRHIFGRILTALSVAIALVTLAGSGWIFLKIFLRGWIQGIAINAFFDGLVAVATFVVGMVIAGFVLIHGNRRKALRYGPVRRELIKLLRASPIPLGELAQHIESREDDKYGEDETICDTLVLTVGMLQDPAMFLFNLAQISLNTVNPSSDNGSN